MMDFQTVMNARREITENLRGSPQKLGRRNPVGRSSSAPFLTPEGPETSPLQAPGWGAFARMMKPGARVAARAFSGSSFGPTSPMFGGDLTSPLSVECTPRSSSKQEPISEFDVAKQESPPVAVRGAKACNLWKTRQPKPAPDALSSPDRGPADFGQEFQDVSINLATDTTKSAEQSRQFEAASGPSASRSFRNQKSFSDRLRAEQEKMRAEEEKSAELGRLLDECRHEKSCLAEQVREKSESEARSRAANAELQAKNKRLAEELKLMKSAAKEEVQAERREPTSTESALRAVMAKPGATVEELRCAINAVESLVGEARRELAAKQLRERRAAFEALHAAIAKADEALLEKVIAEARRAEIDAEDIEKAEAKLLQLRLLTEEERAAKGLEELKARLKPELFLLVKRGNAYGLEVELDELDSDVRWQDWVDFNGRTLLAYARELGATAVLKVLTCRSSGISASPEEEKAPVGVNCDSGMGRHKLMHVVDLLQKEDTEATGVPSAGSTTPAVSNEGTGHSSPVVACRSTAAASQPWTDLVVASPVVLPAASPSPAWAEDDEHGESKKAAFRAVAQDDVTGLDAVLQDIPVNVWRSWENKAGRDLLTLSTDRGSTNAYALLAKTLGLMVERKRETFEEREAVWVLAAGEVLARRATVLEDTPEEADEVFIEFWDGDQPPERIERCCVLKVY